MMDRPRERAANRPETPRRRTTQLNQFACTFVGSFYALAQLPKDDRPCIALAGRSNVGKSSLLNRLVGQKNMAKVSSTPGKTRALNFFLVNDAFYLVDLPGYGYAQVSKTIKATWGELIEQFLVKADHLAGLILLIDSRRDPTDEDIQMLAWLAQRKLACLAVVTKSDKVNRDQLSRKVKQVELGLGVPGLPFSALSGVGRKELSVAIAELVKEYSQR
jgi:GTP-binding protein